MLEVQLIEESRYWVLAMLSLVLAWKDLRSGRLPNSWMLFGMVYLITAHAAIWAFGDFSFKLHVLFPLMGLILGFLFLVVPYRLRQIAAGDVKYLMLIGLYTGPLGVILVLFAAAIIGGLWALYLSWRHYGLGKLFSNLKFMWNSAVLSRFSRIEWDLDQDRALKMPYGVALTAGVLLYMVPGFTAVMGLA